MVHLDAALVLDLITPPLVSTVLLIELVVSPTVRLVPIERSLVPASSQVGQLERLARLNPKIIQPFFALFFDLISRKHKVGFPNIIETSFLFETLVLICPFFKLLSLVNLYDHCLCFGFVFVSQSLLMRVPIVSSVEKLTF